MAVLPIPSGPGPRLIGASIKLFPSGSVPYATLTLNVVHYPTVPPSQANSKGKRELLSPSLMFGTFLARRCHVALVGVLILRPVDKESAHFLHVPVPGWEQRLAVFYLAVRWSHGAWKMSVLTPPFLPPPPESSPTSREAYLSCPAMPYLIETRQHK
jgi:hypothetical protein